MVYGEDTEDLRYLDRSPLSTLEYPGRSHLSQQQNKEQQWSPHTLGFHLWGNPWVFL